MMPQTSGDDPAARTGCAEVLRRLEGFVAGHGDVMARVMADPHLPDLGRQVNLNTAAARELRDVMAGHALGHDLLAAEYQRGHADGLAAAPVPRQRKGRHSAAGAPRPGWQRAALRVIPVGMLGLAAKILSAHRVLAPAALAAAIGTTAAVVQMQPARTVPDYASTAPAPAASIYAAAPVASPAALTRPRTAVRKARRIAAQDPADGPAPVPVPSPSPSPSSPPSPPAPLLTVPGVPVDLGVYVAGSITIGNPQDQPVTWSADCGPDVTLIPSSGFLSPGQQDVKVQVSINPVDGASAASCLFKPGKERVTVTWAGAGSPSSAS